MLATATESANAPGEESPPPRISDTTALRASSHAAKASATEMKRVTSASILPWP